MPLSFDNKIIAITCPKCGKEIKKTIAWFKAKDLCCPFCGLGFDNEKLRRGIANTEKKFAELARKFSRLKFKM